MRTGLLPHCAQRAVAALILALTLVGTVRATDMSEFIHDTQKTQNQGPQVTMVWWIPPEFWDVSMATNPNVSAKAAEDIRGAFRDYQVFAVARATAGLQGLTDLQSKADLVSNARLEVRGKQIAAVPPDQVPPGIQAMLGALKPMLSNLLGQFGKSMELIVYPGVADEQKLIDSRKPGTFEFSLYDQTFHWRTPLASLLPKKIDHKTKEEFPGSYDYNPYTGDKLSAQPPPPALGK
jgi:hypothetical protein